MKHTHFLHKRNGAAIPTGRVPGSCMIKAGRGFEKRHE